MTSAIERPSQTKSTGSIRRMSTLGCSRNSLRIWNATSLGAILLTATAGAALYAARGDVRPAYAALVGIPAVVGALAGTHLQQRVSGRSLTLAFAGLLAVIGIWLIAG